MLGDAKLVGERWVLKHHVGAGSFAVVWKAQHRVTGEVVAIKEIKEVTNKKLMQARARAGPAAPRASTPPAALTRGAAARRAWRGRSPSSSRLRTRTSSSCWRWWRRALARPRRAPCAAPPCGTASPAAPEPCERCCDARPPVAPVRPRLPARRARCSSRCWPRARRRMGASTSSWSTARAATWRPSFGSAAAWRRRRRAR